MSGAASRKDRNLFVPSSRPSARKQPLVIFNKKMDLKSPNAFFAASSFKALSPKLAKYSACTWRSYFTSGVGRLASVIKLYRKGH